MTSGRTIECLGRVTTALLITSGFFACGEAPPKSAAYGHNKDDEGLPPVTEVSLADEIATDVVGSYVLQKQTVTVQKAPFLGDQTVTTTTIGIGEIARVGDGFTFSEQPCHAETAGTLFVGTVVPDAVPRANPRTTGDLVFSKDGNELVFERKETASVVGAELRDPLVDRLPTSATDDRVRDSDNDGHPGVTVTIQGLVSGDVYVVQRTRALFRGTHDVEGHFSGSVLDRSDQAIVGATNDTLADPVPSTPITDPEKNPLELLHVPTPVSCDELVAKRSTFFP